MTIVRDKINGVSGCAEVNNHINKKGNWGQMWQYVNRVNSVNSGTYSKILTFVLLNKLIWHTRWWLSVNQIA